MHTFYYNISMYQRFLGAYTYCSFYSACIHEYLIRRKNMPATYVEFFILNYNISWQNALGRFIMNREISVIT